MTNFSAFKASRYKNNTLTYDIQEGIYIYQKRFSNQDKSFKGFFCKALNQNFNKFKILNFKDNSNSVSNIINNLSNCTVPRFVNENEEYFEKIWIVNDIVAIKSVFDNLENCTIEVAPNKTENANNQIVFLSENTVEISISWEFITQTIGE